MSLMVNNLIGFGLLGGKVTLTYTDYVNGGVQSSPYTALARPVGPASSSRHVAVSVAQSNSTPASALTVNGQTTTRVVNVASASRSTAIFVTDAPVTTGTTADIVVTMGATVDVEMAIWALEGAATPTAPTTATDNTISLSTTIQVPAAGAALAMSVYQPDGGTPAWTGLTKNQNGSSTNFRASAASAEFSAAQSPLTVEATTPGASEACFAICAWGPQ